MRPKVFGGMYPTKYGQRRVVIAARSQKRAAEILEMSLYEFRGYWTVTGNYDEIRAAFQSVGTPFVEPIPYSKKFEPLDLRRRDHV